jgi:3-oxoacyl-[acyl-carrier-protein] synthase-3
MALSVVGGVKIAAIGTCVPVRIFDNINETHQFPKDDVQKVVAMAGVRTRRIAGDAMTSGDLCRKAAEDVLKALAWEPASIEALIMVTQSPDYFLPSTACILQKDLGLSDECAAFDVGLGCSGYPYGLWLAAMMLTNGGLKRVLVLHGETPSRFSDQSDRSVSLLFGDNGSATAMEADDSPSTPKWFFKLHTDGMGYKDMIIEGGGFRNRFPEDPGKHFVRMNGASIFNFTIKRVPLLVEETLRHANVDSSAVDYFILHQSNQFIMKHLAKKTGIPLEKMPIILGEFGNTGGCSIPLAITQGALERAADHALKMLLIGYGVGLSWASVLLDLPANALLKHTELDAGK